MVQLTTFIGRDEARLTAAQGALRHIDDAAADITRAGAHLDGLAYPVLDVRRHMATRPDLAARGRLLSANGDVKAAMRGLGNPISPTALTLRQTARDIESAGTAVRNLRSTVLPTLIAPGRPAMAYSRSSLSAATRAVDTAATGLSSARAGVAELVRSAEGSRVITSSGRLALLGGALAIGAGIAVLSSRE